MHNLRLSCACVHSDFNNDSVTNGAGTGSNFVSLEFLAKPSGPKVVGKIDKEIFAELQEL